jgi:hypothetical protein
MKLASTLSSGVINPWRVLIKGILLFLVINVIFSVFDISARDLVDSPLSSPVFERFAMVRFPNADTMSWVRYDSGISVDFAFAPLVIASRPKERNEFRVIVVGDSSIWGARLQPDQTLIARLNDASLHSCDGRHVVAYNLGMPGFSTTKDLLILAEAMKYRPDLVIWPFTLKAITQDDVDMPFILANADRVRDLVAMFGYQPADHLPPKGPLHVWDRTIVARRAELKTAVRLQFFGLLVRAYDRDNPGGPLEGDDISTKNIKEGVKFLGLDPSTDLRRVLRFDALLVARKMTGSVPVILINEPMYINPDQSSIRYNQSYPRWAYDQYRQNLYQFVSLNGLNYLDLWDILPANQFSNSDFHIKPEGEEIVAQHFIQAIRMEICIQ